MLVGQWAGESVLLESSVTLIGTGWLAGYKLMVPHVGIT